LFKNEAFLNPLVGFFSLIAEIFLLTHVTPLTSYVVFAIINGVLICALVYLVCRIYCVSRFISIFAMLSLPYIVNGANIPGLWHLLPFTVSLLFLLLLLIALKKQEKYVGWLFAVLAVIVYPPMIIFIAPLIIFYFRIYGLMLLGVVMIILTILVTLNHSFASSIGKIVSFILRDNLVGGIPSFAVWNAIPIFLLPFTAAGAYFLFKKRQYSLLIPMLTGYVFWLVYAFTRFVLIIDYPRVVIITSVLSIIAAALGLVYFRDYLLKHKTYTHLLNQQKISIIKVVLIVLFAVLAFHYPRFNPWQKMVLNISTPEGVQVIKPLPSINRYLIEDDLQLFQSFSNKIFISPPWKGLVIGAATHNFPLDSKSSTITNSILPYAKFMAGSCWQKGVYASRYDIEYVYSYQFSCRKFNAIGTSTEGLILYRYANK
jgi:hypothetical protein